MAAAVGKKALCLREFQFHLLPINKQKQRVRHGSCEEFIGVAVSTTVRVTMHSDNRPPTLHREDRTHTATDTQRHLSLCPGPCRGAGLWGRNLPQGEVFLSGGVFLQLPGEGVRPSQY